MGYITLSSLGTSGHLGSQIQIYAGLLAVAKANNLSIVFSKDMVEKDSNRIRVFDLLDLTYEEKPNEFFNSFEPKHINFHTTRYDETLFNLDPSKNYNLIGRFDLYTYWYGALGTEISNWNFKSQHTDHASKVMEQIQSTLGKKPTVSIHLRRGDYLLPHHSFCELDSNYYIKAITDNFTPAKDYNFIVFSNDIEYAKQMLGGDNVWFVGAQGENTQYSDSECEDMTLMSMCDHNIIANSSYSWWAAFLNKNPNKKVICPTNYLKSTHESSWINGSYYPPTWINIDNKC